MSQIREKELVSIIVSNYNNEKYIIECLNSLINQTYKNIEIIIVDDHSTDDSVKFINTWIRDVLSEDEKKKVSLEVLSRNIGFAGAVTLGLYLAKGEYIAMHDGDDYSDLKRIEKQVDYLKNNKDIKVVGSNYWVFNDDDPKPKFSPNGLKYGRENIIDCFAKGKFPISYGTILFYGELFDAIGGLTRKLDGAEDYEFLVKLLSKGIDNIKEPLYFYRNHQKQRSLEFYGPFANKRKYKAKIDNLRVLLVLDSFGVGGTETHVITLAKGLINKGISVTILGGDGALSSEFNKLGCKIYNMDFPISIPKDKSVINSFVEKIKTIIDAEDINIIHGHQSSSGSMALEAAKSYNIPFIFTVHGMYYDDIVNDKFDQCNTIISVSYPVYNWLNAHGIPSIVIPNGVLYENFTSSSKRELIEKELNIPSDSTIITYCSRLAWGKVKTCQNLVRVTKDLSKLEKFNIHSIIIGAGPGEEELLKASEKANANVGDKIIHYIGRQIDVSKYYLASDIIVGSGRVALEGMACNKPVIATGNNGYCGLITESNFDELWKLYFGDHGSLVPNNEYYLYRDLSSLYTELNNGTLNTGDVYNKAKNLFDISMVIEQIINVYMSVFI